MRHLQAWLAKGSMIAALAGGLSIVCPATGHLMAQTVVNPPPAAACPEPRSPISVTELLRNIRVALDCGLLFSGDLYDKDRLIRLFGGTSVKWNSETTDMRSGEVLGLEQLVKPIVVNGITISNLSIDFFWQRLGGDWNTRLNVFFRGHVPLYFEDIVRLFGTSWTNAPTEAPTPHRHYDTVTAPHGNQVIFYDLNSNSGQARVRVEFRGDASLGNIVIISHGRK